MKDNKDFTPTLANRIICGLRRVPGVRQLLDISIDFYRAEEILHGHSHARNHQPQHS
ncbi:MAG: hypothetical protein J7641_09590 [Cyanobacteria bacterium SID2]|nr:hypothetical protein [Cyanobacteria bacterium SID2]MBP0002187.1 hypothetical protein [Cyanobacteria bacterium SBC]